MHTGDVLLAGTNAHLAFTLKGTAGTAGVTLDANFAFRMECNDWNYVTLYSSDLGDLQSITIHSENQGLGANWYLDKVVVESICYGVSKQAIFNCWIDSPSPFTQPLSLCCSNTFVN